MFFFFMEISGSAFVSNMSLKLIMSTKLQYLE